MRNFLLFVILMCIGGYGLSQNQNAPILIPPSPAAQAFNRYGEIPVDYSTGIPNISVPIYTVKGRKLELPISISYHASGIKVNDIASEVGLGWVLNCGGVVSRSILGTADEFGNVNKTFNTSQQLLDSVRVAVPVLGSGVLYANLMNLDDYFNNSFNAEDPISDRFNYSLPTGVSGVFRYEYLNPDNVITLPFRPLKISGFSRGHSIDSISITDDAGTVYWFKSFFSSTLSNTEWYLTKMISADGTDTIRLTYNTQTSNQSAGVQGYSLVSDSVDINSSCSVGQPGVRQTSVSGYMGATTTFNTPVLSSIVSSTAVVGFVYDLNGGRSDFSQLHRLSGINITPVNSVSAINTISFSQSYFGSDPSTYRLRLDSLQFNYPGGLQPQRYSFSYESQMLPPYPYKDVSGLRSEDYWGYYNGSNSPNLIPAHFASRPQDQLIGGNREPDNGTLARACMIKEIKYPTGGKTVFHFGRNYAQGVYTYKPAQDGYVGGFRLDSLKNYSGDNQLVGVKSYQYNGAKARPITKELFWSNVNKGFRLNQVIDPNGSTTYCIVCSWDERVESEPYLPLEVGTGLPVMYSTVTEYNGNPSLNTGKTVYEYGSPYAASDFITNPDHPYTWELPVFYHPYQYDKGNYIPELISKTEYLYDGTNYRPVSKTENTYTKLFSDKIHMGIKLTKTLALINNFQVQVLTAYHALYIFPNVNDMPQQYINSIAAIDVNAYQEVSLLTNTRTFIYDPADVTKYLLTSTDLSYNQNNLEIKEKTSVSSKGELFKTSYKYPSDFGGTSVYAAMVNRNMLSPVIEVITDKNGSFLKSSRTNFDFWNGTAWSSSLTNMILPRSADERNATQSVYETQLQYSAFDSKGNILQFAGKDGIVNTFLWGYGQMYPVAKIVGKSYSDVMSLTGIDLNVLNSLSVTDLAIRTELNKLRNLFGALVTTYTYKPLVGMTSETDPNGRTTFYEYDSYSRLVLVRDNQNRILKKICYNYSGQPVDCQSPVMYFNEIQSQAFTKNDCGSCSQGSLVTYVIPEGTYSSAVSVPDANQLALNDIAQNGQAYANANGNCGATMLPITYNNLIYGSGGNGFVATYTNSSGQSYTFNVPGYGSGSLGCIPAGIYSLTISKPDNTWPILFGSGCYYVSGTSADFKKVNPATCTQVSLQLDLE